MELGVKFRSEVDGAITGVRFYKVAGDNTTHTGSLWSATGRYSRRAHSRTRPPSGWQPLNFSAPIAIAANTTYVASYHTAGSYYQSSNDFQNVGVDQTPLHALKDGIDGPNGVYVYGPGRYFSKPRLSCRAISGRTSSSFRRPYSGSPFSDITPPVISSVSVTSITPRRLSLTGRPTNRADGLVEFIEPCPASGCVTPLVSPLSRLPRIALRGLSAGTYTYRILSKDSVGNVAFTPTRRLQRSGWFHNVFAVDQHHDSGDGVMPTTRAIEVGVKFKSDVDGVISAIRFYKGSQNTGTHTVSLWSAAGAAFSARRLDA